MASDGMTETETARQGTDSGAGVGSRRRRRWVRRVAVAALLVFVVLAAGLAALAPALVSAGVGKGFVLAQVSAGIKGSVEADRLDLSWTGGQRIEGLKIKDADGATLLSADAAGAPGLSLWELISGGSRFGLVTLEGARIDASVEEDGKIDLVEALSSPSPRRAKPGAVDKLRLELVMPDATVRLGMPGAPVAEGKAALRVALEDGVLKGDRALSAELKADPLWVNAMVDRYGHLLPGALQSLSLDEAGKLTVTLDKLEVPLPRGGQPLDRAVILLSGRGSLAGVDGRAALSMTQPARLAGMKLTEIRVHVPEGRIGGGMLANITARAAGGKPGQPPWETQLSGVIGTERIVGGDYAPVANLALTPVPTAMLDQLLGAEGLLEQRLEGRPDLVRFTLGYDTLAQGLKMDAGLSYSLMVVQGGEEYEIKGVYREASLTGKGSIGVPMRRASGGKSAVVIETDFTLAHPDDPPSGVGELVRRVLTRTTARNLPVDVADAVLGADGRLVDALGLDGEVVMTRNKEGVITLRFASPNAQIPAMRMALDDAGRVRLLEDATGEFQVTSQFTSRYLANMHPFFQPVIASRVPVQVKLSGDSLTLPLGDMRLEDITATATIELGALDVRNAGPLATLLGAFGQLRSLRPGVQLPMQVEPIQLTLREGVVTYEPFVMDIDGMRLRMSGHVDLSKRTFALNVGVPGQALRQFRELAKVVPADYVFNVPITGTLDHPRVQVDGLVQEVVRLLVVAGVSSAINPDQPDEGGADEGAKTDNDKRDEGRDRAMQAIGIFQQIMRGIAEQQREREEREKREKDKEDDDSGS